MSVLGPTVSPRDDAIRAYAGAFLTDRECCEDFALALGRAFPVGASAAAAMKFRGVLDRQHARRVDHLRQSVEHRRLAEPVPPEMTTLSTACPAIFSAVAIFGDIGQPAIMSSVIGSRGGTDRDRGAAQHGSRTMTLTRLPSFKQASASSVSPIIFDGRRSCWSTLHDLEQMLPHQRNFVCASSKLPLALDMGVCSGAIDHDIGMMLVERRRFFERSATVLASNWRRLGFGAVET